MVWEKLFPYGEELQGNSRKNCARAHSHLSNTSHTFPMEPDKPRRIVLGIIGAAMVAGWALVIWVATLVTHTALETLAYIVELAQLP